MLTNPNDIKILCYGDSNTWGRTPDRKSRYTSDVRWTGQLQNLLGSGYDIIEEGLGGRTVNLDHPSYFGRNGKNYLMPCLQSHSPLDVVIIMLGTNDLKLFFDSTPESIKGGLSELVDDVYEYSTKLDGGRPEVILISPVYIEPDAPRFMEFYKEDYPYSSGGMSKKLSPSIEKLCNERSLHFIDAALSAKIGEDGLHLDLESNQRLAQVIHDKVKNIQGS